MSLKLNRTTVMLTAKLKATNDRFQTLIKGTDFGTLNYPITVEIAWVDNKFPPIDFKIWILNDPLKKRLEIDISQLENRILNFYFYNPSFGTSGLTSPSTLLENNLYYIKFIFHTELLNYSDTFRITYEIFIEHKNKV